MSNSKEQTMATESPQAGLPEIDEQILENVTGAGLGIRKMLKKFPCFGSPKVTESIEDQRPTAVKLYEKYGLSTEKATPKPKPTPKPLPPLPKDPSSASFAHWL